MRRLTAAMATAALALTVTLAPPAEAARPGPNPWTHGLVLKRTDRLTVGDWKRYARSKDAHHIGRIDGHTRCWVVYGPTSFGQCKDGYRFTS